MKRVLNILSFSELTHLIVCFFLDFIEYVVPVLLTPVLGDILDFVGFIYCIYAFGWIGSFSILEIIPLFDVLPLNLFTWAIWVYFRRSKKT